MIILIDTDLLKLLSAVVVAIFLAVPYWKRKYFTSSKAIVDKVNADNAAKAGEGK